MATSFSLKGEIALTNLPDQLEDFQVVAKVADETVGVDQPLYIRDGHLIADIDTSEASHSTYDRLNDALHTFLDKHAVEGAVFILREDDTIWTFGPTPLARWKAACDYWMQKVRDAQSHLEQFLHNNPIPD